MTKGLPATSRNLRRPLKSLACTLAAALTSMPINSRDADSNTKSKLVFIAVMRQKPGLWCDAKQFEQLRVDPGLQRGAKACSLQQGQLGCEP